MTSFLKRSDGGSLAYIKTSGSGDTDAPTFVFCGGFRSDMEGSKALAVCDFASQKGLASIRFDYFAHGKSEGDFVNGSIGRWKDDTLAILDELTDGPVILTGSSMGGWISVLAAEARPEKVVGLQLLAAAPDFTRRLMWAEMDETTRAELTTNGVVYQPNDYSDEPYEIHHHLIDEGDSHLVLNREIGISCPVRLMHGLQDTDVPWQLAQELMPQLVGDDVEMELVKNGDHRLSGEEDLARLRCSLSVLLSKMG